MSKDELNYVGKFQKLFRACSFALDPNMEADVAIEPLTKKAYAIFSTFKWAQVIKHLQVRSPDGLWNNLKYLLFPNWLLKWFPVEFHIEEYPITFLVHPNLIINVKDLETKRAELTTKEMANYEVVGIDHSEV